MAVSGYESEGNILCEQDVGNLAPVLLLVDADVHQRAVEVLLGDFIERRWRPVRPCFSGTSAGSMRQLYDEGSRTFIPPGFPRRTPRCNQRSPAINSSCSTTKAVR